MNTLYETFKGSCIYRIINKENGHSYIGSAVNFAHRRHRHFNHLKQSKHHSIYLQRAWDKYGQDAFEITIMEECPKDQLISREQHFIDLYKPEYNMCPKAGSKLGCKLTEDHRAKIILALKGRKHSEETLKKMSEAQRGRPSPLKGKTRSEETRKRISEGQIGRSSAMKGKTHSEEAKKKISEALKGKTRSEEHSKRISEALKRYRANKGGDQ